MRQEPIDLTTPPPAVSSEPLDVPRPEARAVGIQQSLDVLAATAAERAAATADGEEERKVERVARLAGELDQALSAVRPGPVRSGGAT